MRLPCLPIYAPFQTPILLLFPLPRSHPVPFPTRLLAQVALPVLAVRGTACHGAQQVPVDLNHLLHGLGSCEGIRRDFKK